MRPALAALAEQQKEIDSLKATMAKTEQRQEVLGRGLSALARMAGVESKVAAAMLKRADVQNPGQPVPEPPAGPPAQSTQDAKTPEAFADVRAPGLAPGTTNDVAADATTTAYTPGMDIAAPAFKQLVDVTQPVDGTQNPRPLEETKTLTDVRVGDPMNPEVAFPLRGEFQNAQRTSARQETGQAGSIRTMACIRLARLQIAAGLAEGNDLAVAARLEADQNRALGSIEQEIGTLEKVRTASARRQPARQQRLVPRPAAGPQRVVPSMQQGISTTASTSDGTDLGLDDADLFD